MKPVPQQDAFATVLALTDLATPHAAGAAVALGASTRDIGRELSFIKGVPRASAPDSNEGIKDHG